MLYIVLAVLAIGVLAVLANRRKPTFTVLVHSKPDGSADVLITPGDQPPEHLASMALMYGAKIRWLLNNEPAPIREFFGQLVAECADAWSDPNIARLSRDSSVAKEILGTMEDAPMAVPGGEAFEIRYTVTRDGGGLLVNTLPRPGMSPNLPWHYIHVLDAVRAKQSPIERRHFADALGYLADQVASADANTTGLRALTTRMEAAHRLGKGAMGAAHVGSTAARA